MEGREREAGRQEGLGFWTHDDFKYIVTDTDDLIDVKLKAWVFPSHTCLFREVETKGWVRRRCWRIETGKDAVQSSKTQTVNRLFFPGGTKGAL